MRTYQLQRVTDDDAYVIARWLGVSEQAAKGWKPHKGRFDVLVEDTHIGDFAVLLEMLGFGRAM
jgi:hypothetical protein